jgi:hypothetical protein
LWRAERYSEVDNSFVFDGISSRWAGAVSSLP